VGIDSTSAIERKASGIERLGRSLTIMVRSIVVEPELSRVCQLLHQASELAPGEIETQWGVWLESVAKSLHLRPRLANLTCEAAYQICLGGAALVTLRMRNGMPEWWTIVRDHRDVVLERSGTDESCVVLQSDLAAQLGIGSKDEVKWMIVTAPELSLSRGDKVEPLHPISRLIAILRPERHDLWTVASFAIVVGILSIASPIAVESLVNTVAFGSLLQPILVLATILFILLAFLAAITGLQTYVVEILQRRLFSRVAADLSYRIPRVKATALDGAHFPELMNRFFEVVTLQKGTAYLVLDGIAIVLTTLVGMAVLAFYHPWFLGFDVVLLAIVALGVYVLGQGALANSVNESKQKYRLAAWLEEMARCSVSFRSAGAAEFGADRASVLTSEYLHARQRHFSLLFRQILLLLFLQAVAATITLGFGGWLVIQGQLTLGQLVAAELIVSTILVSLAKLGKHLEGFYDLLAGVDKLGKLLDLPIERQSGVGHLHNEGGTKVVLTDVQCKIGGKSIFARPLSAQIAADSLVAVVGGPGSGKSVLLELLYALRGTSDGHIEVDDTDPNDIGPEIYRKGVGLVRGGELFAGTVSENLYLGQASITQHELRSALDGVGLLSQVLRLPNGLETELSSNGHPLSATQQALLLLARALVRPPRLLLIDGLLDVMGEKGLYQVFQYLRGIPNCTVLIATNRESVASECDSRFDMPIKVS